MRVYLLHLQNAVYLERAFDRVLESPRVASCAVEPEQLRLRFMALRRHGDVLVEQIYLEGGLVWCSRHELEATSRALSALPDPAP